MELAEKKIVFEDIDLVRLLGPNDRFLKQIEKSFSSDILIRGNNLVIKGSEDEIHGIEKVFKELAYMLNRNKNLTESDVATVIGIIKAESGKSGRSKGEKPIFQGRKDLISARTPKQIQYLNTVIEKDLVFAIGPAGTGKTFLAVAMALQALKNNEVSRIIITRPAVEAGESLGFLPGDLREKVEPYLRPVTDALQYMLSPQKVKTLIESEVIEITPLAYMRGRTLSNSFIILDEAQNTLRSQMKMFLTRIGAKSKVIVTGDVTQIDLPKKQLCGLTEAEKILRDIDDIGFIYFDNKDVVRHKLVAKIITAYENSE